MTRFADIGVRTTPYGLDTGGYHSLEHSLIECSARLKHIRLWWSYFGQERVEYLTIGVFARVLCRFNSHWWLPSWDIEDRKSGEVCNWCEVSR